jgi:hypothetical protein
MPRCSAVQRRAMPSDVVLYYVPSNAPLLPVDPWPLSHCPCRGCGGQAACGSRFSSLHHMASQSPDPLAPGTANNNERIRRQLEDSARRPDCGPYNRSAAHRRSLLLNSSQIKSRQVSHVRRQAPSVRVWLRAAQASNHSRCPPHTQLRERASVHVECSF